MQRIGTSGFILKDGKVLLLKRSADRPILPGYYDLPGGKLDFGESLEEGVIREVLEETGLKVKPLEMCAYFSYIFNNVHYVDIEFLCEILSGELKISSEHESYVWAAKDEVAGLKISKEMLDVVMKGFESA